MPNYFESLAVPDFALRGMGGSLGRFGDIWKQTQQGYAGILEALGSQGESTIGDIARAGKRERAGMLQSAISRGLASSTVLDSMRASSLTREGRESGRVRERVAGMKANVMERGTQALSQIQQAFQQLEQQEAERKRKKRGFWGKLAGGLLGGLLLGPVGAGLGGMAGGFFGGGGASGDADKALADLMGGGGAGGLLGGLFGGGGGGFSERQAGPFGAGFGGQDFGSFQYFLPGQDTPKTFEVLWPDKQGKYRNK